ncbi:protein of unknown function [Burkholderia multivorans]
MIALDELRGIADTPLGCRAHARMPVASTAAHTAAGPRAADGR